MYILATVLFIVGVVVLLVVLNDYTLSDHYLLIPVIIWIIAIIVASVGVAQENSVNTDACESIGGEYKVVDTEETYVLVNNVMTPTEVDVYGCVKE